MRYDLSAVNDDLRAVLVRQLRNSVYIGDIARHVGGCGHGNVLDLSVILPERSFEIVIYNSALLVNLSIFDLAALSPAKVVCMVLHSCRQNNVVLTLYQRGSELVQSVGGIVAVEDCVRSLVIFRDGFKIEEI